MVRGGGCQVPGRSDSRRGGCRPKGWRRVRRRVPPTPAASTSLPPHDAVLLASSDSSVVGTLFWNVLPDCAPLTVLSHRPLRCSTR